jgi:ribosomal protein S18 acetylase RimI-like enzyme
MLLAYSGDNLVGYALVRAEANLQDVERYMGYGSSELETLVFAPDQRGRGIGALLLDRVESELERLGVKDVIVGALPTNAEVLDLYRSRGFEPTWLVMTRSVGRPKA